MSCCRTVLVLRVCCVWGQGGQSLMCTFSILASFLLSSAMGVSALFSFSNPPEVPVNPPWFVSWAEQQSYRVQERCLAKFQHSDLVGQVQSISDLPQVLHAAILHIDHLPLQKVADIQAQQLQQKEQRPLGSSKSPTSSIIKFVLSRLLQSETKIVVLVWPWCPFQWSLLLWSSCSCSQKLALHWTFV